MAISASAAQGGGDKVLNEFLSTLLLTETFAPPPAVTVISHDAQRNSGWVRGLEAGGVGLRVRTARKEGTKVQGDDINLSMQKLN